MEEKETVLRNGKEKEKTGKKEKEERKEKLGRGRDWKWGPRNFVPNLCLCF